MKCLEGGEVAIVGNREAVGDEHEKETGDEYHDVASLV